jgi:phosphate transport system substrate-binding protein
LLDRSHWIAQPRVAALLLGVAVLVAACGGETDGGEDGLSGSVSIDGSSTVFPATEAMAEEFMLSHRGVRVNVGVSGTGGGFKKFCNGETDISDASRPIKDGEQANCAGNGIEWLELRVGLDGLAVVTNRNNDFVTDLTLDELRLIWEPAAEGEIKRWNQVRVEWPDKKIDLYGPGVDSGTFDFFTEAVMGESKASRPDYTASERDTVLVIGVSGSEHSLGYFGFAYFLENAAQMRLVPIEGVEPSDETVSDGSYPLSRPLFIYVNLRSLAEKEQVREFVRFYLSDEGAALLPEVGYTPIPLDELSESRAALEAAIGA